MPNDESQAKPGGCGVDGIAGWSRFDRQAAFQFRGVKLSTISLNLACMFSFIKLASSIKIQISEMK